MKRMQPQFPAAVWVKFLHNAGLYIHIPFCKTKCAYCDFYSCVPSDSVLEDYLSALCREMEKWGGLSDRPIDSVYIGGGTPSILGGRIEELMISARNAFNITSDAEITSEINPDAEDDFLYAAKRAGINRISMGVQSADDAELKVLGRRHTAKEAKETYYRLLRAGFDNISLDLMLCLPDSNISTLKKSIDFMLDLRPAHISAYILKLEERTKLYAMKNTLNLPNDDESAEQYLYTCKRLEEAGYNHYEISNFALNGKESRHNLKYWKLEDYLGIGPSAHSLIGTKRFFYGKNLREFLNGAEPVFEAELDRKYEEIMLGLRLKEGIDIKDCRKNDSFMHKAEKLEKAGLARLDFPRFSLTDSGMLVSNAIINDITETVYENL